MNDSIKHQLDCSDVCSAAYDTSNNIVLSDWLPAYAIPTNDILIAYVLADVLTWYNNFYTIPSDIAISQLYKISTSDLKNVYTDPSMMGYTVFDTTAHINKFWNGSVWEPNTAKYLSATVGFVNVLNQSNVISSPDTDPNGGVLYVESGSLKFKNSSGVVTVLVL